MAVDDHAMGITHVIRAEEWIPSLPLHFELYRAFGWQPPVFAHMPLLRNKDKSKISKRKNPTSLLWYRDAGFLPEALRNFLGMMGFSLPNDQEIFTYEEFLKHFDLAKVNTGGPIFDLQKLHWLDGEWMRRLDNADLERRLLEYLKHLQGREAQFADQPEADQPTETFLRDFEQKRRRWSRTLAAMAPIILDRHAKEPGLLARVIPLIKERLHTLAEAADYVPMFYTSDFKLTREALVPKKQTPGGAAIALKEMRAIIEATDFSAVDAKEKLDAAARTKSEALGQKIGVFLGPVRVAITGTPVSPPLMESLLVLGKADALYRIDAALAYVG
jgi:glutamyl-tRNA synthetase